MRPHAPCGDPQCDLCLRAAEDGYTWSAVDEQWINVNEPGWWHPADCECGDH